MSRTVLVTGGAGYVGSHACKALAGAGYLPVTYDDLSTGNRWAVRWGPLEMGDVRDEGRIGEVIEAHAPVAALHFAALALVGESVREPARYWRVNAGGVVSLLDACRARGVGAVVFSSTCAVYGEPERMPIAEDAPKAPVSPYGRSKLAAEQVLADYSAAYGLRHISLRYFNAAGADPEAEIGEERAVETHLVPLALDAVLGRRPPLRLMGEDYPTADGTAIRDYIHVSDLAEAHVRALDRLLGGGESVALNLGTGRGHSVREVIAAAERVTGRPVPHESAPRRPGDPSELVADPSRSRALLGPDVTARSTLDAILETAWAWHSRPGRGA
ncbi:MAG TPA: UDP-glucose 4-epimerase GalE [Thermohalobaculum sp.]|nr:UDP-glucose 4-epimerase GalE [Thermohalobaculum sp.]